MNLKTIIGNHSFWMINKELYRKLGWKATLLLQHLIDIEDEFFNGSDEFYKQVNRISQDLGLSKHDIRIAKEILIDANLISITKKGSKAKDYFVLHKDRILNLLIGTRLKSEPVTGLKSEPLIPRIALETNNTLKTKNNKKSKEETLDAGGTQASTDDDTTFNNFVILKQIWTGDLINSAKAFNIFSKLKQNEQLEFIKKCQGYQSHGLISSRISLDEFLEDEVYESYLRS